MGRQIPHQSILAKTTKPTIVKISKRFRHRDPGHILQLLFANLYDEQTVNTVCQQTVNKSEHWSSTERAVCYALSHVWLFATPWAVARQAPLSMEFSRQEYWSGLPGPPPGIFPIQGLKPGLLHCRQILYRLSHQGSPWILEWAAYPFSKGSSQPRNWIGVSCIVDRFFTSWATR